VNQGTHWTNLWCKWPVMERSNNKRPIRHRQIPNFLRRVDSLVLGQPGVGQGLVQDVGTGPQAAESLAEYRALCDEQLPEAVVPLVQQVR
jgi:hypothetical protein